MPDPTGRTSHIAKDHRGIAWKQPVRVATTASVTLSGLQTIDGVVGAANDRVLVKDNSTGSQNGIYSMQSGAWVRDFDMDQDGTTEVPAEEIAGAFVYVISGTANGGKVFHTTNVAGGTLDSTSIVWTELTASFSLTIKDEGGALATGATSIDFVGAGVTASGTGAAKTVTIPGGASALDDLTDVTITSPANANRLRYDGSASLWKNSNLVWEPMIASDGSVMTDGLLNPMQHEVPY